VIEISVHFEKNSNKEIEIVVLEVEKVVVAAGVVVVVVESLVILVKWSSRMLLDRKETSDCSLEWRKK